MDVDREDGIKNPAMGYASICFFVYLFIGILMFAANRNDWLVMLTAGAIVGVTGGYWIAKTDEDKIE